MSKIVEIVICVVVSSLFLIVGYFLIRNAYIPSATKNYSKIYASQESKNLEETLVPEVYFD